MAGKVTGRGKLSSIRCAIPRSHRGGAMQPLPMSPKPGAPAGSDTLQHIPPERQRQNGRPAAGEREINRMGCALGQRHAGCKLAR